MFSWLLLIIYLTFISFGLPDGVLGAAWPVMSRDLNLPIGTVSMISMTISCANIASSLISGYILKFIDTGKLALISCILTAAALFGFAQSSDLLWLIVLAIPLGLGGGAIDAAMNHYISEHYAVHHMNWLHCFWGVGATLGPIVMAGFVTEEHLWRTGYVILAAIQGSIVIILLCTLKLWTRPTIPTVESSATIMNENNIPVSSSIWSLKGIKPTLITFLAYNSGEGLLSVWAASFLVHGHHITAETAAVWISFYFLGITIGRFAAGFISLKMPTTTLIRFGQVIALFGAVLLILPLHEYSLLLGLLFIGLGFAPIFPSLLHETPARFGKVVSAKLIGIQMAFAYTGITFAPVIFGSVIDQFNQSIKVFPFVLLLLFVVMIVTAEIVNVQYRSKHTIR